jgi:RNA polymerase sigma factor (sigma-70 family)
MSGNRRRGEALTTPQAPKAPALGFGDLVQQVLENQNSQSPSYRGLWEELYARLHRSLVPWIEGRTKRRSCTWTVGVEDIFQETLVRFVKTIRQQGFQYVDELSTLKWFYTTARYVMSEAEKSVSRTQAERVNKSEEPSSTQGVSSHPELDPTLLDCLSPEERNVVEQRFLGGYSLREIAKNTGRGLSACKHISASALTKLRKDVALQTPPGSREDNTSRE